MKSYLKVKIKSLAAEARIIRFEERKVKTQSTWIKEHQGTEEDAARLQAELFGLHHHRVVDVRQESRVAGLAYAYVRGKPYRRTEPKGDLPCHMVPRIAKLVNRYGSVKTFDTEIETWLKAA